MRLLRPTALALAFLAAAPAAGGDLRGSVSFLGKAPALPPAPVTKDQSVCGQAAPDETLEVSAGKLANVVVVVRGAPSPPAAARVTLDQKGCRYLPHVQAVPLGSALEIVNGDPILHNTHGYIGHATAFNLAMPGKDQRVTKKLDRPGLVRVKCDVHGWMAAYIVVSEGPAAVSGADGSFVVPGIPPGRYTVTAWHESLGERTAQVTVPASGDATVAFAFGD